MEIPSEQWIPSEEWIEGVLCGGECYRQLAAIRKLLTEKGLQQVAEAFGEEFYPTDEQRGHEFVQGFLRGYAGQKERSDQLADEQGRDRL